MRCRPPVPAMHSSPSVSISRPRSLAHTADRPENSSVPFCNTRVAMDEGQLLAKYGGLKPKARLIMKVRLQRAPAGAGWAAGSRGGVVDCHSSLAPRPLHHRGCPSVKWRSATHSAASCCQRGGPCTADMVGCRQLLFVEAARMAAPCKAMPNTAAHLSADAFHLLLPPGVAHQAHTLGPSSRNTRTSCCMLCWHGHAGQEVL